MLKLYGCPNTRSTRVAWALEEAGAEYDYEPVILHKGEGRRLSFLRVSPSGKVPVLVDGDLVIYETAAICLHLLDTHAQAGLAPLPGTPARAECYQWLAWLTNTLQATLLVYFYPERWADDEPAIAQVKAHAEARIAGLLEQLDARLADRRWLLGADFSAVDLYALVLCRWTRGFASRPAREFARLGPYLQRLLARPAVQRALAAEKLSAPYV